MLGWAGCGGRRSLSGGRPGCRRCGRRGPRRPPGGRRWGWSGAAAGGRCWVRIGGEGGVGKTRRVTESANEVAADGARVLVGNCPPVAPGLVPFGPVVEVLRELGPATAEGLAAGHAEAIE